MVCGNSRTSSTAGECPIEAFVAKKLAGKEVDRRELKRVSDALLRRGYQWQEIRPVLDRYSRDDLD